MAVPNILKGNIYRKQLNSQTNNDRIKLNEENCKFQTQTQTLQIGCQDEQQYSLRTKLCLPSTNKLKQNKIEESLNAYTQLESEITLHVLGYWNYDDNFVVISRSMSNEILCSVSFFIS